LLKFAKLTDKIFILKDGGFGHSISSPSLLEYYLGDKYLLIFPYKKNRHNKLIADIFNKKVFFLKTEILPIKSLKFNYYLIIIVFFILKKIFQKDVQFYEDYLSSCPVNPVNQNYNIYHSSLTRSRYFWIPSKKNFIKKILPLSYEEKFIKIYQKNSINKFRSKILFNLRNLTTLKATRNLQNLDIYKNVIMTLADKNFQIVLKGDNLHYPKWISDIEANLIYKEKTNLTDDEYGIFCGMTTDIAIGANSGGMLYSVIKKNRFLIIDNSFLGDALPNSIVSYWKLLNCNSISEFKEAMLDGYYYRDLPCPFQLQMLTPDESSEVILDFVSNYYNKDYGIDPASFGINKGVLADTKAKFSPVWVKLIGI
jgi:hypothetical protein